jgi:hypothetical protein
MFAGCSTVKELDAAIDDLIQTFVQSILGILESLARDCCGKLNRQTKLLCVVDVSDASGPDRIEDLNLTWAQMTLARVSSFRKLFDLPAGILSSGNHGRLLPRAQH